MDNKIVFSPNLLNYEELFDRIYNQTLHVPDNQLESFTNEIMEAFYQRDRELDQGDGLNEQ